MVKYGNKVRKVEASRIIKPLIGILLMLISLLVFFYWENQGREVYMEVPTQASAKEIHKGQRIKKEDSKVIRLAKDLMPDGALGEQDFYKIENMKAKQYIPANSILLAEYFSSEEETFGKGESVFTIPQSWIFSRSSSLRRGDLVEIRDKRGEINFGTYRVAFVKNAEDQEVKDSDGGSYFLEILDRESGTGKINHIEIICSPEAYLEIAVFAENERESLIIFHKENYY